MVSGRLVKFVDDIEHYFQNLVFYYFDELVDGFLLVANSYIYTLYFLNPKHLCLLMILFVDLRALFPESCFLCYNVYFSLVALELQNEVLMLNAASAQSKSFLASRNLGNKTTKGSHFSLLEQRDQLPFHMKAHDLIGSTDQFFSDEHCRKALLLTGKRQDCQLELLPVGHFVKLVNRWICSKAAYECLNGVGYAAIGLAEYYHRLVGR
ncbi:S-adenosyl-L-methionine-dependentmethyltransferases superfamily protein [Striga asiatica]|uniref:S-adenosyl-L-methionine-dependentmethyltransferases superfamily protein n=1 Tax=Striga asiatica TaxID=4170 RepID=A0A5A7NW84_STRAF|nr:S-adenosyl-L-methionine-dependentmethyltransferases superfamily protein [Striga asiatica]